MFSNKWLKGKHDKLVYIIMGIGLVCVYIFNLWAVIR